MPVPLPSPGPTEPLNGGTSVGSAQIEHFWLVSSIAKLQLTNAKLGETVRESLQAETDVVRATQPSMQTL